MSCTQTLDLEFIKNYITEERSIEKLVDYLERHEIVGEEIFSYLGEKYKDAKPCFEFKPIPKALFLKRLPFYFFKSQEERNVGDLRQYVSGIHTHFKDEDFEEISEKLYLTLEEMFYNYELDLETIFNYPIKQTGYCSRTDILFNWKHYLVLAEKIGINNKTPKHIIVDYNHMLEKAGLEPIIYETVEYGYWGSSYFGRSGNVLKFSGVFPCDKEGKPILRWIGLKIKNDKKTWLDVNEKLKGTLCVETTPFTSILGLNCWGCNDDGSDLWYPLYTGPQLMEFDYNQLKYYREREKLTQKQVAEAIGSTVRTYQKWESGATCPDCRYLLRLMNVLDIQTVQDLTKLQSCMLD